MLGHLHGHSVAVVAVGERQEDIGFGHASCLLDFNIFTGANHRDAGEVVFQPIEGGGVDIDHGDIVTFVVELSGQGRAQSAATHDDDAHRSDPVSWLPGL